MSASLAGGSVLVVVMNRDDRRVLFETLDTHEFDAIFTAKDFVQAHSFLKQGTALDAVLLEFVGDAADALQLCAEIESDPSHARTAVIGIASVEDLAHRWGWGKGPKCIVDWLRSPVFGEEALHRILKFSNSAETDGESQAAAVEPATVRAPVAAAAPVAAPTTAPSASAGPATAPAAENDYRFAFDGSPDEIILVDLAGGQIVDVNATAEQRSGWPRSQLLGKSADTLEPALGAAQRKGLIAGLREHGRVRYRSERKRGDGSRVAVDVIARLLMRGREPVCLFAAREAIEGAGWEEALGAVSSIALLPGVDPIATVSQALQHWLDPDFLLVIGLRGGEGEAAHELHRVERGVFVGLEASAFVPFLAKVSNDADVLMTEGGGQLFASEPTLAMLGVQALAMLPLLDERAERFGALLLASSQAMTNKRGFREGLRIAAARLSSSLELERAREQGRANGLLDSLTGMPNRLLFNDRLDTTIKEASRTGEMFAVLFVDLDRFKTINDSLGHGVGDEVLVAAAKRLRASIRGSDTVARYAGDEFTLILRHIIQRDDVLRIAEKICRVLEAPLTLDNGRELHITASIGVSFHPDDATTAEKLLQHADVAMYSAKGMGRNTYQTYVAVPEESHQQRLALEAKLRVAERNNELRVFYQPQMSSETEDIVGMEALIRWEHPELGMISPGFFIPLAEDTGLIVPIGEWVLRQACKDAKRWQDRFGLSLRVGVNLSALQLRQLGLAEVVKRVLDESGLQADLLELEVTESLNVKSIPNLIETLQALRDLGCGIAIDDFGTGQSSLDYIKRFPADRIKIDQVFVRNIGVDPDDEAIVRATIDMARSLNRSVVAEGVEYEQHREFLKAHGCEELQGYLFCRPLPAISFENLLVEREKAWSGAL